MTGVLVTGIGVLSAYGRGPEPLLAGLLVLDGPREQRTRYALSLNCAFGGANTALLVGAP